MHDRAARFRKHTRGTELFANSEIDRPADLDSLEVGCRAKFPGKCSGMDAARAGATSQRTRELTRAARVKVGRSRAAKFRR